MTVNRLIFTFLLLCGTCAFIPQAVSQPDCQSPQFIEELNQGIVERTAHIKGDNAILFIALDPVFSAPEFDYGDHYRDEHYIEAMKSARESLYGEVIDEVIVWRILTSGTLGAAVAFREGCAVEGHGEPDHYDKLMLMHKAYLEISRHGLDATSTRNSIKKLLLRSRYSGMYKDEMIDIVINNLRPLMANTLPSGLQQQ